MAKAVATTLTVAAESAGAMTPHLLSTGTSSSQHHPHLRGLSFNRLAVDADVGHCVSGVTNSPTAISGSGGTGGLFVAVYNRLSCAIFPPMTVVTDSNNGKYSRTTKKNTVCST